MGLYALTTRGNVFVIFLRLKRGLTLSRVARAPVRCPLPTRAAPEGAAVNDSQSPLALKLN